MIFQKFVKLDSNSSLIYVHVELHLKSVKLFNCNRTNFIYVRNRGEKVSRASTKAASESSEICQIRYLRTAVKTNRFEPSSPGAALQTYKKTSSTVR